MKQEDVLKLQNAQMIIMDEIHRICVENNIKYYMIGGTALGAIRHKGFIPWDVDIDIAMPRADYDYFKEVCKEKLSPKFKYNDYETVKNHRSPHALITMKGTGFVKSSDKYNNVTKPIEIFVDIMPLDTPPDDEGLRVKQAKAIKTLSRIKCYKTAFCFNNNIIKKLLKKSFALLFSFISYDTLNKKLHLTMCKYKDVESEYICSMASHYSYKKQCMKKDIYGTPTLMKFEDREYYAPEKVEEYLTIIYGDYMKLPSKEAQEKSASFVERVIFDE